MDCSWASCTLSRYYSSMALKLCLTTQSWVWRECRELSMQPWGDPARCCCQLVLTEIYWWTSEESSCTVISRDIVSWVMWTVDEQQPICIPYYPRNRNTYGSVESLWNKISCRPVEALGKLKWVHMLTKELIWLITNLSSTSSHFITMDMFYLSGCWGMSPCSSCALILLMSFWMWGLRRSSDVEDVCDNSR